MEASCRGASRLVGEGANEGEGPGTGTRGWKATEGRQGTRKATIDPWSPSVLPILFLPSTLSSSAGPLCLSSFPPPSPSLLHSRHDLTNSLCALLLVLFLSSAAISSPFGSPLISIVANSMPRRPVVSP